MAGGSYVVKRGANGAEQHDFGSKLPAQDNGVRQSSRFGGSIGAAVVYDKAAQDAIVAGYMPVSLTRGDGSSVKYDEDPVGYVTTVGIRPRSKTDVEALRKYPELALHLLNEATRANSQAKATTGFIAGTAIHASLGSNYPADAKASAMFAPTSNR